MEGPWPASIDASWATNACVPALPGGLQTGSTEQRPVVLTWTLRRNCSITPRQLGVAYAAMVSLSMVVASGFLVAGVPLVFGFAVVELAGVGAALLLWARHAGDRDVVSLCNNIICVQRHVGPKVDVVECSGPWIRVESNARNVTLRLGRQQIQVGAQAPYADRAVFAEELRRALRAPGPRST